MRTLPDTQVLVRWLESDSPRLSPAAYEAMENPDNEVLISAVSVWEIVIKKALGKLQVPDDFVTLLEQSDFVHLPVTYGHALQVANLPMLHKDPFDRLLVAQAQAEGLVLVTTDAKIFQYNVDTIRA